MRFGLDHPVLYRVIFMQRFDIWRRVTRKHGSKDRPDAFELLVETVSACVATGRTRSKDVEGTALALWALVHGVVALALTMPFANDDMTRKLTEGAFGLADLEMRN